MIDGRFDNMQLPDAVFSSTLQIYVLEEEVQRLQVRCHNTLPEKYARVAAKHSEAANDLNAIEQEYRAQVRSVNTAPELACLHRPAELSMILDCLSLRDRFLLIQLLTSFFAWCYSIFVDG